MVAVGIFGAFIGLQGVSDGPAGRGGLGDKADCKFSYVGGSIGGSWGIYWGFSTRAGLGSRLRAGLREGLRAGLAIPFNKIEFLD